MIRYSVQCSQGHVFDEWFSNSADYDVKAAAGEIACPDCGDHQISKAIMAPSVAKSAAAPAAACPVSGCAGGGCPFSGGH
ncbi:hypothetical protein GALL_97840 [mine drainage metagenome]|uniref:Uncharacterized protein n=1 Tax=mine drainage metagenome TaxID=410659 RepID=A0A1J5SHH9_9ZZZZ